MGEARRRGTFEERRRTAIKRNKDELVKMLGPRDEEAHAALRAGISPFLARLSSEEWRSRKEGILAALKQVGQGAELETAKPIRIQEDEIAWYLYLCQQALDDPLCMDVSQVARAAPFFAGIGLRWSYVNHVSGIYEKIDAVLHDQKSDPDGLIFEILVAFAYAEAGWAVEFLDERPPLKSADLRIIKEGVERFVECKRLSRRTSYSETERNEFLRLWDAAKHVLLEKRQWVWFRGIFHVEVSSLQNDFLASVFTESLPISSGEVLIYDGPEATIHARLIDRTAVQSHLKSYIVKANSPMLAKLLGRDWAPLNSSTTIAHIVKVRHLVDADAPVLGAYIEEIAWACGFTRDFDSEISLDKKAKDVTKRLADAVKQVPTDKESIIHIAAETMEGKNVELLRTKKVMASIPNFITDKPVLAVRFHRFQANQTIDKLFEFDETVSKFEVKGASLDGIPETVVVPSTTEMNDCAHWELYQ